MIDTMFDYNLLRPFHSSKITQSSLADCKQLVLIGVALMLTSKALLICG